MGHQVSLFVVPSWGTTELCYRCALMGPHGTVQLVPYVGIPRKSHLNAF